MQTDTCKTCNDSQFFAEIVNQFTVSFCLVFGYKRMHTHKFRTAEGQHFCRSIQLHGAGAEGNHGVCQRDVLAVETLDVAHHLRFRMVFVEYFMCQIGALAFHLRADAACHGYVAYLFPIPSGGNGKDGEQYVDGNDVRSLIDAHTYVPILEITQVHFLAQGDGTYLLCRNGVGQCKAERVEILYIDLLVSQSVDTFFQKYGNAVDAFCNGADTFRTVIYGIEASHRGKQCLCGTDVGSRLFTLDVLLAGLQRHAVAQLAVFVFRPANDASRHIALVLVAGGKVGCRRRCRPPILPEG